MLFFLVSRTNYTPTFKHFNAPSLTFKAIEIKPDFHLAWSNKGVALSKLGRDEEADEAFNKAKELESKEK